MVIAIILCILALVLGILFCFFGYRYLRKLIMGFGFLAGAITAYILLAPTTSTLVTIALSAVIGAATGAFLYYVYVAGIFILGAIFGSSAVCILCVLFGWNPLSLTASILMVVCAIVMGVMAVLHRRSLGIICTAFTGGMLTALLCGFLIFDNPSSLTVGGLIPALRGFFREETYWVSLAGAGLSAAGMLIQFFTTATPRKGKRK